MNERVHWEHWGRRREQRSGTGMVGERKEAELGPLKQIKGTREWCGRAQGQVDGLREYWEHWGSGGFR